MKPTGSNPAVMYGLPKIHKASVPLRPIMAAYNTASYKLAKFLVPILSPFTTNGFTVKNSFELSHFLTTYSFPQSYHMVSYDVQSLFTNIPLDETIDICTNLVFSTKDNFMYMTKAFFKNLLCMCVKDCLFIFNGEVYKQIDGVAMGSPLGPTFANIFLSYHEQLWLNECPDSFKPILYRRYVDDTLVIFKEKSHSDLFLNFINSKHKNMKFTMESESNSQIPFLDLNIRKENGKISVSLYRKPTFSGLGTSFFSFCHYNFKLNSIRTLLHRAYTLSSCYTNFHKEVVLLKTYFYNNGFTTNLFESIVNKFLLNKYCPKQPIPTVDKEVIYLRIPYLGEVTNKLQRSLNNTLSKAYPDKIFRFVAMNTFKINSFFRFKDVLPTALRSSTVYQFTCSSCQAGYVGSTTRSFKTRVSEHFGQSARTGRPLQSAPFSAIGEHSKTCKGKLSFDDFNILASNNSDNLRILESLYIYKLKPTLNNTVSSYPLYVTV